MVEDDVKTEFVITAYDFLLNERGFPSPSLGIGQHGDEHHQPNIVASDPTTKRRLCIIELLAEDDSSLREEQGKKCFKYRTRNNLNDVPAYLLTPGGGLDMLRVFILNAQGEWQAINSDKFPTYVELTSLQSPLKQLEYQHDKAADNIEKKATSMYPFLILIFVCSVSGLLEISTNDLWLLAGIGFLVIFPNLKKVKLLNFFEAEREAKGK